MVAPLAEAFLPASSLVVGRVLLETLIELERNGGGDGRDHRRR